MLVGIDASRAFIDQRTGVEEYSYQVISHLRKELQDHEVFLYIRKNQKVDFELPENWKIRIIKFPFLWTQIGLSLEMLFHPIDVLFIPAHVVPIAHPRKTIVTVHGLEFEIFPEGYSFCARLYMHWSIKASCRWAKKIITVSENTKKDLTRLYKVPEEKIEVVYEGVADKLQITNYKLQINSKIQIQNYKPYLLFIGRMEKRKNIEGIIDAYKILREKYDIPHSLILVGSPGYGFEIIKLKIKNSKFPPEADQSLAEKIIETGFVTEEEKWQLLSNADVFLFPTFYEGFGLPVLEAQSVGVPVVTSNISSLPEVGGDSVIYCDPKSSGSIAEAVYSLISNPALKNDIIKKGHKNAHRFSWSKCVKTITDILIK